MDEIGGPLKLRSIGAEIADRLEAAIVREAFRPGEKLREIEICERFGISRSPLREAFQILEGRGLVERKPRLGTSVTPMSLKALDDITLCRIPLEGSCARLLAEHPDHEAIASRLDTCLDEMRAALAAQDLSEGFEANVRLTMMLHETCGNPVLARLLRQLDTSALRYRYGAYIRDAGMLERMIEANVAMIAAIRDGNGDKASDLTEELVRGAWHATRRIHSEAGCA